MGKLEGLIKSEIVRLSKREMRKASLPLGRDVRSLKATVSQLRKTVAALQRMINLQQKNLGKEKTLSETSPEEVKTSRLSPRLIRSLRNHLGITQKELAVLAGVTVGAIHQWESGMFKPTMKKKGILVSLRKIGRREVRNLLQGKEAEVAEKKVSPRPVKKPKKKRRR